MSETTTGRLPIAGRISSPFGWRIHPILKTRKFHNGVDVAARQGTPLPALWAGVVLQAHDTGAGGNTVTIDAGKDGQGRKISYSYCHLHIIGVKVGEMVTAGQIVGTVGTTGRSTGPHLHLTLRVNGEPVDPQAFTWISADTPASLIVDGERLAGELHDGTLYVPARPACTLLKLPCEFAPPASLQFGTALLPGYMDGGTLYVPARDLVTRAGKVLAWNLETQEATVS